MAWREIHHNFFVDNYSPGMNVDNDDGSYNYHTHHNFLVYATAGLKSDFGGHDNYHHDNLYAYLDTALALWKNDFLDGHNDRFINNRLIYTDEATSFLANSTWGCNGSAKPLMRGNTYYTANGSGLYECGADFMDWQQAGNDAATTLDVRPLDELLLNWARDLLDIHTGGPAATAALEAVSRWELQAQPIVTTGSARLNTLSSAVALGICSAALLVIASSQLHHFCGVRATITSHAVHGEELAEKACMLLAQEETEAADSHSLLAPP